MTMTMLLRREIREGAVQDRNCGQTMWGDGSATDQTTIMTRDSAGKAATGTALEASSIRELGSRYGEVGSPWRDERLAGAGKVEVRCASKRHVRNARSVFRLLS